MIGSKKNKRTKRRRDIDVENIVREKSRDEQRSHEGDKEVVKEVREKGTSDDDSNDDDDEVDDYNKPKVFQSMSNLQICTWFVSHPDILQLANKMSEMSKPGESPITSSSSNITDVSIKLIA
jgi:uncharacterized protein YacL